MNKKEIEEQLNHIFLIVIQMLWIIPAWFIGNTAFMCGLELYHSIILMLFSTIFITFYMKEHTIKFVEWLNKKIKQLKK